MSAGSLLLSTTSFSRRIVVSEPTQLASEGLFDMKLRRAFLQLTRRQCQLRSTIFCGYASHCITSSGTTGSFTRSTSCSPRLYIIDDAWHLRCFTINFRCTCYIHASNMTIPISIVLANFMIPVHYFFSTFTHATTTSGSTVFPAAYTYLIGSAQSTTARTLTPRSARRVPA
jgi:hypothetical protein